MSPIDFDDPFQVASSSGKMLDLSIAVVIDQIPAKHSHQLQLYFVFSAN